jgi:hypothetical protein
MRLAGHVARKGNEETYARLQLENLEERDRLEDLGVYGKIILERILGKLSWKVLTGCIWLK